MRTKTKASSSGLKSAGVKRSPKPRPAFSNNDEYGLRDLFTDELKALYWSEKALTKALVKIAGKCHSGDLKDAVMRHAKETEEQVSRLEKIFSELGMTAVSRKCEAMNGLISEAEEHIAGITEGSVRDAAIILAAQKIEHYEIACYGTLCVFANMLNEGKVSTLLKENLSEEKNTDESLSRIAEDYVNMEALIEREWEE
jgi:ferritin-like metal-binding protein YciE